MAVWNLVLLILLAMALLIVRRQRRALVAAEQKRVADLAEQNQAHELAQQAAKARMETMLDTMIEGLVVIDSSRRIVLANRAAEAMFHFSRMMAGGTLLEALRHHEVASIAQRALTGDAPIEQEVRVDYPEARQVQMSAVTLRDHEGARAGAVLVFHDVTRLRLLESVRQDFVANVSHELRTPLSLIKSAAETLLDGGRNDPAVTGRFLQIIDKHATRLTLLIDDLLLLARLDSGRIGLDLQRVPLRSQVQETLEDAEALAGGRRVRLENAVPEALVASADPARLRQVVGNLVENAIKYGREEGTVTISARPISSAMLEVCVRDDGPGIPVDAQERIFERFYRVDKARSREQGGTGLGLAIVKNLVQAHGGDVRLDKNSARGAAFYFTLPSA